MHFIEVATADRCRCCVYKGSCESLASYLHGKQLSINVETKINVIILIYFMVQD